ncbi:MULTISPECIES: Tfp pilus assembly protein FimT/FimU [Marichromatium]|uniref:Prepilin-type N-terminal cleavage/methylation domain-containing protein n=1 Tax=Marichromatium gracile TaxID=1048 RepID=A0A4R4AHJ8_MARGR|nr:MULTISPECIES: hypothetical protein [Marichromatium]MBO8084437.1 hypothetical protein [Marichromatium sp.]TCW38229.1 hypothetical protein EDC29_102120 [Marichromatium gracile]
MTSPHRNRGLSTLEMAFVLVITGLLVAISVGRASLPSYPRDGSDAQALAALQREVFDAVLEYARRYHRLPCADGNIGAGLDPDGREGAGELGCGDVSANRLGHVPFRTLGLDAPSADETRLYTRLRYAVYRSGAVDLTSAQPPSWQQDAAPRMLPGDGPYAGRGAFLRALRLAAAQPRDDTNPYLTGDDGPLGTLDCVGNKRPNVAFLVLSAGTRDADLDGDLFDGPHTPLTINSRCFAAPGTPTTEHYDDTVIAIGFDRLAGELLTVGRR